MTHGRNYTFILNDYSELHSILADYKSDPNVKKSALEQLTIGLNDHTGQIGRKLFNESPPRVDAFSLCLQELKRCYEYALEWGVKMVNE